MEEFPDHYTALGVDPTADQDVIAAAFRALAKKYHPDTGTAAGTASPERFAEVQEAYEVLGNPERRVQYDADLLEATQRALDAHLAAKTRRFSPGPVAQERLGRAGPDLGAIRPEAAGTAASRGKRGFAMWLVAAFLLVSAASATALWNRTTPPAAPEPAAPEPVVAVQAPAAAPVAAVKADEAPQEPLFGSSATSETEAPEQVEASVQEEPELEIPLPTAKPAAPPPAPKPAPVVQQKPKATPADRGLFALVILEKSGSKPAKSEQASVLFTTRSNCVEFGVKTVLRRLAAESGPNKPRIWYECRDAED
jgi:hypothetical protein